MATLSSSFSSLSLDTTPHRLSKTFTKQPFSFPLPTKSSPSFPSITLRAQSSTDDIASFFDNPPPEEDSVFDPPTPPDDFTPTPYFVESSIEADEGITAAYEELYGPAYSGVSVLGNDVHVMDAKKKKLTGWGKPKKEKLRDGFDERVVQVRRVTKVVKGGKQLHFRAVVVVGDKQGNVGVGVGKAKEVIAAVQKSAIDARRNIVAVPLTKYSTSPHSRRGSEHELHPSEGLLASVAGGIVALGKFDALHIGHRELAIQASKLGAPYLLSFVGMAEVFGWEPRAPIVAKCDRSRVLSSWSPYCGNLAPTEVRIEFSSVRHLTPKQFVEKLSKELGVGGVVAGENYRFGYKAAGDALDLVRLCEEYGIGTYIINSVMDKNQDHRSLDSSDKKDKGQVSSTRVRHALDVGDMRYVSELLGRQHRLILIVKDMKELPNTSGRCRISAPKSCLLNQPPKDGLYGNCFLLFGSENQVPCRVFIDTSQIHLEVDGLELSNYNDSHEARLLGIEFGECGSDSA